MATPDKSREDGERTGYSVRRFYDELSADYHLIFPDREASIARQGEILGALIEQRRGAAPQAVLDCSRGIGTQAIGLSAKGHRVIGSDLSPPAAARAAAEASSRDATLPVAAADIRALPSPPPPSM
jgi:SAM-dependent methyltransferase